MASEWDDSSSSSSDEDKDDEDYGDDDCKRSLLASSGDFDSLSIFRKVGPLFTIACHG
ncbi:hypothetical protein PS15m_003535 [Mucor circinelloides]